MTGTQHVNDDQNQAEILNNNSNMKTKRKKLLTIVAVIILVIAIIYAIYSFIWGGVSTQTMPMLVLKPQKSPQWSRGKWLKLESVIPKW